MEDRFLLTTPADELASHFEAPNPPQLTTRYNVAPPQVIAVVEVKPDTDRRGIDLHISTGHSRPLVSCATI